MGDPRTGEIYQLAEGQQPKEGDIKLTEGQADFLNMLTERADRIAVMQRIVRDAKEDSNTIGSAIMGIVNKLARNPNIVVDPSAWQCLLVYVPKEAIDQQLDQRKQQKLKELEEMLAAAKAVQKEAV